MSAKLFLKSTSNFSTSICSRPTDIRWNISDEKVSISLNCKRTPGKIIKLHWSNNVLSYLGSWVMRWAEMLTGCLGYGRTFQPIVSYSRINFYPCGKRGAMGMLTLKKNNANHVLIYFKRERIKATYEILNPVIHVKKSEADLWSVLLSVFVVRKQCAIRCRWGATGIRPKFRSTRLGDSNCACWCCRRVQGPDCANEKMATLV